MFSVTLVVARAMVVARATTRANVARALLVAQALVMAVQTEGAWATVKRALEVVTQGSSVMQSIDRYRQASQPILFSKKIKAALGDERFNKIYDCDECPRLNL